MYKWTHVGQIHLVQGLTIRGLLFSHEKEGNPTICDNVDGPEGIMLREISQTEKDKYMISLICGI